MYADEPEYERDYHQETKDDQAMGPPREEPNCITCCDSGRVWLDATGRIVDSWDEEAVQPVREEGCHDCNPSPEVAAQQEARYAAWVAERDAQIAAGTLVLTDEPPF
jgi:hypothetical protein